jgi:D-inositol-3-phosphate glycosyltransferase
MVSMHTSPLASPGAGDAGGMNIVEWHEALALAALGHEVDLITRRGDPAQPDAVEVADGVTVRHLTAGPESALPKSQIDAHIPQFAAGLAELGPYDLYHSHHWMSGMAALPLAHERGVPHIQSYHSVAALPGSILSDGEPPESPGRVPGEAYLSQESDLVVAISAAEADTVVSRCGANPCRVAIVPPGVDTSLFHPLADPVAEGDGGRATVFFAGRLQPLKGPDLAIAAVAHVDPAIRPRLVIAGAVSQDFADYAEELRRLVDEHGLADDVEFIGPQPRPDLARWLRRSQICLVPSHSETFGLIALEAAASGTPVIAAAAGGLREAVVHGESGQLMDSRRPQDWADAITRLLSDPARLTRMGVVARIHARRFTWERTARELESLYRKAVLCGGRCNEEVEWL